MLPQYFPNAIKKFPNQMLRELPRTDFNTGFTRYNAVECSESYIVSIKLLGGKKDLNFVATSKLDILEI